MLHTVENNIYYVTLIDVKTAAVLQKLAVMDDFTDEDYTNITETDDFTCIRVSERRICVRFRSSSSVTPKGVTT